MKSILHRMEKHFAAVCLLTIAAGMAFPEPGRRCAGLLKPFLFAILFFTALRIDFGAMRGHFSRPGRLAAIVLLLMVVFPLAFYGISTVAMPGYALGILVLAAMPAGMASTALTVACGGEGALALIVTFLTSVAAPVTVPLLVNLSGHAPEGGAATMAMKMLDQSLLLVYTLLGPVFLAYVLKKFFPGVIRRFNWAYGGLAILSLGILIWIAMSIGAESVFADVSSSLMLLLYLFGFSAVFHTAGYFMMPSLSAKERTALSVNTAYVNNAIAIVFAREFFPGRPEILLPAVLLELPMTVMLIPLKYLAAAAGKRHSTEKPEESVDK
ncbi:MAG: bile acid:sodium symporter [Planctomycetes bacterium]|nr:bile acid:sodium symporter [Planctomycetota bacterium]